MKKCPKCGAGNEDNYNRCKSCFASLDGCSVADGARHPEQDEENPQEGGEVSQKGDKESCDPFAGRSIGFWNGLKKAHILMGVVLSIIIGCTVDGMAKRAAADSGKSKKPAVVFSESNSSVLTPNGNLDRRKLAARVRASHGEAERSDSVGYPVLAIGGMIFTWAFIVWLRVIINARVAGEDWWLSAGVVKFNNKLIDVFIVFEFVLALMALRTANWSFQWGFGILTIFIGAVIIGFVAFFITCFMTHCITHEDP